jgi:hypothetical protein
MWDSVGSFGTDNTSAVKAPYLIPDDANVVMHVNAVDLNAGSAKVGPIWTKNGTVPVVAAGGSAPFRPGVGPLTSVNNFSLANGNVIQFTGAQVWSCCLIYLKNTLGNSIGFCTSGTNTTGGWTMIDQSASFSAGVNFPANIYANGGTPTASTMLVMQIGWDGTNMAAQLNNNTYTPVVSGNAGVFASPSYLGTGITLAAGVYDLNGVIYEAYSTKTAPSSALFTSIYNAILAAL